MLRGTPPVLCTVDGMFELLVLDDLVLVAKRQPAKPVVRGCRPILHGRSRLAALRASSSRIARTRTARAAISAFSSSVGPGNLSFTKSEPGVATERVGLKNMCHS